VNNHVIFTALNIHNLGGLVSASSGLMFFSLQRLHNSSLDINTGSLMGAPASSEDFVET
jgi:hypothetical protein